MAIGRLSMKVGKVGKAGPHAAYIAREGKYAARLDRNEKLEATESGNMPAWAQHCPQEFWNAADANERKNGTTYREMEIALPRELSPQQRIDLVHDFVRQEIGTRHAYQWAIHSPKAADGNEQPHLHLMFSERQCDGYTRDPEQYFKRYNSKNPANGGARKGYGPSAGLTLSATERKTELRQLRYRWETSCNTHLQRAGSAKRIDMRSHAERNTGLTPERKYLPSEWRDPLLRAKVIDFRQARAALSRSRDDLRREVPSVGAEIISLEKERERRTHVQKNSGGSPQQTIIAAGPVERQSDMSNTSNRTSTDKKRAERMSREEAGRIATGLSQKNERRENLETMRQIDKIPQSEKSAQELRAQKERSDQEKNIRDQVRRMEQARSDEGDRLINQLKREREEGSACVPSAMEQMNAQSARSGKALDRGNVHGHNVSSIEQMRARAMERGHFKDQALKPEHDRPSVSKTLDQIRSDAETRRLAKEQNSNEADIER
ncbi:MobA/MobL family protein [Pseudomonas cannabina]|uniref:MobA/MobL protein n=1 Tax=Pseudomonas cannabina TaxID=86840 RepID=A0A0P9N954_PSECA|nr:MobA/MobL family protein [Pseudomonas cannabina]KAA8712525.1 MobA/MobL family protein [Pseudomonas cannabina]KPW80229.1 MobA/MobL protein [Pseudomonas cannabina]RMN37529.1 MobA/MobL protein [Pseudomonas cannabina]SDR33504.1 MobA/MobL family protein [Pseudomonas cannabina]